MANSDIELTNLKYELAGALERKFHSDLLASECVCDSYLARSVPLEIMRNAGVFDRDRVSVGASVMV
jgi:hypothetical protein